MVFDKAEQAESLEKLRERYNTLSGEIEAAKKRVQEETDDTEKEEMNRLVDRLKKRQESLAGVIEKRESEKENE